MHRSRGRGRGRSYSTSYQSQSHADGDGDWRSSTTATGTAVGRPVKKPFKKNNPILRNGMITPEGNDKSAESESLQFGPEIAERIIGTCEEMCPKAERILREREGLLHKFEVFEDLQDKGSSWPEERSSNIGQNQRKGQRKPLPKADPLKTVKSFARSAAGQDKTVREDLRPIHVLKETLTYLLERLETILTRSAEPFNVIYDFVFDRLRSIRQDLVIQRIENEDAIWILECIVRFHVYSDYRLRDEQISIYDPHINQKHLVDVLRKLIVLYDTRNYCGKSRPEFEALNCLVSINSYQVMSRAVAIKEKMGSRTLTDVIEISLAHQNNNFVTFFRKVVKLPCILQLYCVRYVPVMRARAFKVMSSAYGVNTCKIPLSWLAELLVYPSISVVHSDLGNLEITIVREEAEKFAKFQKSQLSVIDAKASSLSTEIKSDAVNSLMQSTTISISKLCINSS